jgi:hypothetical protein
MNISPEVIEKFHSIYQGNRDNLKKIAPILLGMGLGYMDILQLAMKEIKLGLGEAIMLLEIPDVLQ